MGRCEPTLFEQIDALPGIYYAKARPGIDSVQRFDRTEKFFTAQNATIKHGGNRAYHAQERVRRR
jgi:antirestriction protein ArdC